MNDVYRGIGAKNCSRDERGQYQTRVHLQSLAFFHNIKNKQHICNFSCADDFLQLSPLPKLVNNENETFKISFECNHEEADSRMIFHALKQKTNVLLCSKDTDILVLMVFVYALNKIIGKWNISEMTSQQSFPKFTQLQGVTQLLFYMSLIKLKCFKGKEKMKFLNTISVSCKVSYC